MAGTTSSESVVAIPTTQHKADDFNRLLTSNKNFGQSAFSYDYDCYSNRWHQSLTSGSGTTSSLEFDANNYILSGTGVTHDAAGNVTNDGSGICTFDAENHIICVVGVANASCINGAAVVYYHNAVGERIRKTRGGNTVDYRMILAGMS